MATLAVEQDSEAEPAAVSSSGYVEEEETNNRSTIIKTEKSYEMNNNAEVKNCISIKSLSNAKVVNGHYENSDILNDEKPEILSSTTNTNTISASSSSKIQQQQMESSRRENLLVMRLTTKEQEVQEYLTQLEELKSNITSDGHIKHALLDPAVNLMFQKMKNELEQTKEKLEQSVQEFDAWKFTPDSQTGKRLMAKCRMLIQENEDLGKMTNSGRIAKLEGDLAVSRKLCDEMKNSQTDVDAFLLELDESMEAMQSTAMALQCRVDTLQEENQKLKKRLLDAGLSIEVENGNENHQSNETANDDWSSPPPDKKIRPAREEEDEDSRTTTPKTLAAPATIKEEEAERGEVVLENQPNKIEADERTLAVVERGISSPLCYELTNCPDNDEPEF